MSDMPEHEHRYETFCADCGYVHERDDARAQLAAERQARERAEDARDTYRDEAQAAVKALNDAEAALGRARAGLVEMRDFYVKRLAGKAKAVCTLCGSEEGAPHAPELGCGRAASLLEQLADPTNTPKEPTADGK